MASPAAAFAALTMEAAEVVEAPQLQLPQAYPINKCVVSAVRMVKLATTLLIAVADLVSLSVK